MNSIIKSKNRIESDFENTTGKAMLPAIFNRGVASVAVNGKFIMLAIPATIKSIPEFFKGMVRAWLHATQLSMGHTSVEDQHNPDANLRFSKEWQRHSQKSRL